MPRYQHPPIETLYQRLDQVIHARMVEIRQAYRDTGSAVLPPFEQLWDSATADVRRAMDEIDPPAGPPGTVRVPLLGTTRDEAPRDPGAAYLAPWRAGDGPSGNGDADLRAIAEAHGTAHPE